MQIEFDPLDSGGGSGTVSFASWQNEDLKAAIRTAFRERPHERLVRVIVGPRGMHAYFESRPAAERGKDGT